MNARVAGTSPARAAVAAAARRRVARRRPSDVVAAPALPARVEDAAPERAHPWELSVASGLQAGALVRLDPDGAWSIGPDETDDVMIRDPQIGPARALLRRGPGGATLRAVSGAVSLGEESLAPDRTVELTPGATVRLGGVTFELAELAQASPPSGSATPADASAPSRRAPAVSGASERRAGPGRTLARAGAAVLGVLAVAAAWLSTSGALEPPAPERPSVASLLEGSRFAGLELSRRDGLPVVGGVLADDAALRELEALLAPSGDAWVSRLETDASLATKTLEVLRVNGADAELIDSAGGAVGVRTTLPASVDLDALRETVLRDLPALAALELENVPPPVVPPRDAPRPDPGKRVAMVVAGPPAHVVTEDRTRYFVGAVLPSGHRIVAIEDGRVSLERDGLSTVLDF